MKKKTLPLAMMAGLGSASSHQPQKLFGSALTQQMLARNGWIDECLYCPPEEPLRSVKVRLLDAQGTLADGLTLFNELTIEDNHGPHT